MNLLVSVNAAGTVALNQSTCDVVMARVQQKEAQESLWLSAMSRLGIFITDVSPETDPDCHQYEGAIKSDHLRTDV